MHLKSAVVGVRLEYSDPDARRQRFVVLFTRASAENALDSLTADAGDGCRVPKLGDAFARDREDLRCVLLRAELVSPILVCVLVEYEVGQTDERIMQMERNGAVQR